MEAEAFDMCGLGYDGGDRFRLVLELGVKSRCDNGGGGIPIGIFRAILDTIFVNFCGLSAPRSFCICCWRLALAGPKNDKIVL